jgi:hypothetical protein
MGILVQREFTVAGDHRLEFERQSRFGVWENMRHNGAQMIAFGGWAFGGLGDVVVTHSAYADFDHWTATRGWGAFATDPERVEETQHIRSIFAGRPRLIDHSRATIIEYDSELSEPTPFYRTSGDELALLPPTYGRQSIMAESRYRLRPGSETEFLELSAETLWPWLRAQDARMVIYGNDPLTTPDEVVVLTAYRSIGTWHQLSTPAGDAAHAFGKRQSLIESEQTRLLMVQTDFGNSA